MSKEQPLIIKFSLAIATINMILSALVIIGLPVIVMQMLAFDSETANRLYGYAEGVMAMGSLCGGMGAGMLEGKMKTRNGYLLLFYDALTLIPIGQAIYMEAYLKRCVTTFIWYFLQRQH